MPLCAWQDIILTVKEKLSIRSMEYFALVLEEQYNVSRLYLLHEEELIQQVPWAPAPGEEIRAGLAACLKRDFGAQGSAHLQVLCTFSCQEGPELTQPGGDRTRIRPDFHRR